MKTIKSMLLISRKRAREAEVCRAEASKRAKLSAGSNSSVQTSTPKSRSEQDAEIEAVLAHFTAQMETLQAQVVQLERLERERRKLFSIIRKEKLCILLSN